MSLTREEALNILNTNAELLPALVENAYKLRAKYKGNRVNIQLLTNVRSGNCTQNCAYCAQSRDSEAPIEKYRYVEDKKLYGDNDLVDEMHLARHCIGLSGIRFADDDIEKLAERIRRMKKNDTQICCSIGFLTEKQALILKEAGLNRINHNLNSSRRFYPSICTTHTYQERIDNLKMLKGLGFEICSGGIIGMGETPEDVVDMLFELLEINPDSVPINFLLPVEGTRLAERDISALTPEYCIKVLCLARLMLPKSDIRCAAGREV
ncbi:MAG: biotin synthase BioB, partial [Fibrobacter sp.]|nr:biotin synthase BioB [Fibrobacter sp.]